MSLSIYPEIALGILGQLNDFDARTALELVSLI